MARQTAHTDQEATISEHHQLRPATTLDRSDYVLESDLQELRDAIEALGLKDQVLQWLSDRDESEGELFDLEEAVEKLGYTQYHSERDCIFPEGKDFYFKPLDGVQMVCVGDKWTNLKEWGGE